MTVSEKSRFSLLRFIEFEIKKANKIKTTHTKQRIPPHPSTPPQNKKEEIVYEMSVLRLSCIMHLSCIFSCMPGF